MTRINPQNGAVFIYILMAIVLFGALSYAISRGSRSGTSGLTDEQAKLAAQEVIDYGNTVANAVQKLKLRGCADTEISFEGMITSGAYVNPNAPIDELCHVLSSAGTINYISPNDTNWLDESRAGEANYGNSTATGRVFVTNVGTPNTELIIYTPYIKKKVCEHINNILNLNIDLDVADTIGGGVSAFLGDYTPSGIPEIGDENTDLAGKTEFCFLTGSGFYNNVTVLIAR